MRKNFGSQSWLYPMPVLIVAAYDEAGVPNAMNAAWGGIFTDNEIQHFIFAYPNIGYFFNITDQSVNIGVAFFNIVNIAYLQQMISDVVRKMPDFFL
mgnify:CR=1 FL=1